MESLFVFRHDVDCDGVVSFDVYCESDCFCSPFIIGECYYFADSSSLVYHSYEDGTIESFDCGCSDSEINLVLSDYLGISHPALKTSFKDSVYNFICSYDFIFEFSMVVVCLLNIVSYLVLMDIGLFIFVSCLQFFVILVFEFLRIYTRY